MPNFTFYGAREQATMNFSFFFWTWIWSLGIQIQLDLPVFDKVVRNNCDKDWKSENSEQARNKAAVISIGKCMRVL